MNWMNNLRIRTRLLGSFGLLLLLMGANIGLSARNGQHSLQEVEAIVSSEFVKFELVAEIDSATKSNARNTLELFVSDAAQRPAVRQRMNQTNQDSDAMFASLEPMIYMPEGPALFADMKVKRGAYVAAFTDAARTLEEQGPDIARVKLQTAVLPAIDALAVPVDKLLELQKRVANNRGQAIQSGIRQQVAWSLGLGVFAVAVGLVAAWLLMASIMKPLAVAKGAMAEMAKGNLAIEFDVVGHNELSDMMESLHHMKEHLGHVLMRIQESANSVANASTEIAAANLDLSSRTEEQASALQETAATMEELTSTVHSNAGATAQAHTMAEEACASAREVGTLVTHMVATMEGIHGSSQRIRDIVAVIDSIAFQTNILALNAAVEAARAGEQGRGFAVVASEVRSLAQRSSTAAKEIKALIDESVSKVESGTRQVDQAGETMKEIVASIEGVTQIMRDIAASSSEQAQGISQINQAVALMDSVTQQNAALVEEASAASSSLQEQAQQLKQEVSAFKL